MVSMSYEWKARNTSKERETSIRRKKTRRERKAVCSIGNLLGVNEKKEKKERTGTEVERKHTKGKEK